MTRKTKPIKERFYALAEKGGPNDCWIWIGAKSVRGYGEFSIRHAYPRVSHRVAFEMEHGPIPPGMLVDHICHNRLCVNPAHLRLATMAQNSQNQKMHSDNTSGYKGVSWNKNAKKWIAKICVRGQSHHLGYFVEITDAYAAYCEAAKRLHGEFACFGEAA